MLMAHVRRGLGLLLPHLQHALTLSSRGVRATEATFKPHLPMALTERRSASVAARARSGPFGSQGGPGICSPLAGQPSLCARRAFKGGRTHGTRSGVPRLLTTRYLQTKHSTAPEAPQTRLPRRHTLRAGSFTPCRLPCSTRSTRQTPPHPARAFHQGPAIGTRGGPGHGVTSQHAYLADISSYTSSAAAETPARVPSGAAVHRPHNLR